MIGVSEDRLQEDDHITSKKGCLVVKRNIVRIFGVCRCRECEDRCQTLTREPYRDSKAMLCIYCNNNHTQKVDGKWVGPFVGPRYATTN